MLPANAVCCVIHLICGNTSVFSGLQINSALQSSLLGVRDLDEALERTLMVRFRTGQFDPQSLNPWRSLDMSLVNSERSKMAARVAAEKGMPASLWQVGPSNMETSPAIGSAANLGRGSIVVIWDAQCILAVAA